MLDEKLEDRKRFRPQGDRLRSLPEAFVRGVQSKSTERVLVWLVDHGNITATITQTMTGQVDVGFGAAPFGLDLAEDGKIRIIITGNDVASLRTRTVRVNLTSVSVLQNRREAIVRFNRAYQETVNWMYSDPAALKHYGEYSSLPEKIVLRVRSLIPQENLATGRVEGAGAGARWAIMNSAGMRSSKTTTMRSRRRLVDRMLTE